MEVTNWLFQQTNGFGTKMAKEHLSWLVQDVEFCSIESQPGMALWHDTASQRHLTARHHLTAWHHLVAWHHLLASPYGVASPDGITAKHSVAPWHGLQQRREPTTTAPWPHMCFGGWDCLRHWGDFFLS